MPRGFARRKGKWWAAIEPYQDADGAWKQRSYSSKRYGFPNTKRGAEAYAGERVRAQPEHPSRVAPDITLAAWLEVVISARHRVKPNSRRTYRDLARLYIVPHLGSKPVRAITKQDVLAWHGTLRATPSRKGGTLAAHTIVSAHRVLATALRAAVEDGLARSNAATRAGQPLAPTANVTTWDDAELAAFLRAADASDDAVIWRLFLTTGLRIGELLALAWDDVDWAASRLIIRRSMTRDEAGHVVLGDTPKTAASAAPVALPASVLDLLRQHQDRQRIQRNRQDARWQDTGRVFVGPFGHALNGDTIRDRLSRLCAEAGVPRATPHQLRHLNASVSLTLGQHPKVVQERLRHAKIATTLDLYSHLAPGMAHNAASDLSDALDTLAHPIDDTEADTQKPG